MSLKTSFFYSFLFGFTTLVSAQVNVDVNFDMRHTVGGVDSFDRDKFIVLHADATEGDYIDEIGKLDSLINLYDAYYGRETGRMRFTASQVRQNQNRPGFADPNSIAEWGTILNDQYGSQTQKHPFENKGTTITAAQAVPFYPNGNNPTNASAPVNEQWFFSTNDVTDEPFGSATGQFMGIFMNELYGNGGVSGPPKPKYVEVMNEPVWPLVDENLYGGGTIDDIFKMHLTVADSVRRYSPDSKIGGFCTAFPDLERPGGQAVNNQLFGQWEERWKRFIDEVGPSMDFYSVHLYDFPSIGGKEQLRKGSNMEATLDMIEHYNTMQYGSAKPWVISEYGSQLNDFFNQNWSPYRDWLVLKAFSSMMMQFMERPNTIEKTVPFALGRADFLFGEQAQGFAYPWRMMRRQNEPASYTGDWVFTEVVKFYQLWSDVKGTRVDTKSTDPDVMVDAYVDQASNKAYLLLNNIDEIDQNVNLNEFGLGTSNITGVKIKHLYLGADNTPKLDVTELATVPDTIVVNEEACMIIEYSFGNPLVINESSTEEKTYATTYKQAIAANQAITFTIPDVNLGAQGEAILRLGIGRDLNSDRLPLVAVNGNSIVVPTDYRGDIQQDRDYFFGVLEIPVDYTNLVSGTNSVSITFPDDGGFVSSCALQTFDFSRSVTRSGIPDRARSIDFSNKADYIPDGSSLPTFVVGQTFPTALAYSTGSTNGVEEDLSYVAMQVRQVDGNFGIVNTSSFEAVVNGDAANADEVTFDYTLPTTFDDGTTIPISADLPAGHKLFLLIFMSVDNDMGFADANTEIVIETLADRTREIVFANKEDYIPVGGPLPEFDFGQTFSTTLNYSTGIANGVEEDLFYVAMQLRQVDGNLDHVNTSSFQAVVNGNAPNADEVTFDYVLPTTFSDGTAIPTSANLPAGHKLMLLIFMSVDNDAGFADTNTEIVINEVQPVRDRQITFVNRDDYIPAGEVAPNFIQGQTFSTTLDYSTGIVDGIEEDLSYVAMQVRQVDGSFGIVNTSSFQAVVNGDAANADEITFDYTLPTTFDDGTLIPASSNLPTGHKLLLLIFMSVDGDAGFADANTEIALQSGSRDRQIAFTNKDSFIPPGETLPTFKEGQTFSATLDYSTGIANGIEEDLSYVAMQVRQLDGNFGIVNTSTFQVVVDDDAANADQVTFDYTLPTTFDDGTAIPTSTDLPGGHQLFLLIFMSVDANAGFADANTEIIINAVLPDRDRTIAFANGADYIPSGGSIPTFEKGQTFPVTLEYSTGVSNCVEEDLFYIAMQLQQVDADNNPVHTSTFQAVVDGNADNVDTVTFDYTLPKKFDDGTKVKKSKKLPEGHRYLLLIFMSVNDDTAFANANTEITVGKTKDNDDDDDNEGDDGDDDDGDDDNDDADKGKGRLVLYPNPVEHTFTITASFEARHIRILIYDLYGKIRYDKRVQNGPDKIEVSAYHLKPGFYTLKIVDGNKAIKKLFVKK